MMYSYARVSTDGQSAEAPVTALTAAGAVTVYREVASGAQTERAQLRQVLARLAAGDVLMVTRLARLARSTRDLLNTLATITAKGAGFTSLGDTWADTTPPRRELGRSLKTSEEREPQSSETQTEMHGLTTPRVRLRPRQWSVVALGQNNDCQRTAHQRY